MKIEPGQTVYYIGTAHDELPSIQEALVKPKPEYWKLGGDYIWLAHPKYPHSPVGGRMLMTEDIAIDLDGAYTMLYDAIQCRIAECEKGIKALVARREQVEGRG